MISRRLFLALTGGAVLAPAATFAEEKVPSVLDHIMLGCNDLDRGIAVVEEHTGVRAAFGGVHPDRGTANALLSLGELHYLEIIAPNPRVTKVQPEAAPLLAVLKGLTAPQLITWAVHPSDLEALAKRLRHSGIAIMDPRPGSRKRPDGRVLSWKSFSLVDDHHGLLPFFIEWSPGSVHPSSDAPKGCQIEHFAAVDPDPGELLGSLQRIGIDMRVEHGVRSQLRAWISGPKGAIKLTS
jgi:catechol 2,3-dioxygenase-like lactoylglutathione lyase family enzyme